MHRPNVVVVGYGFAGRYFHAYLVGLADGLRLYGIVSSRPEARQQAASRFGVKTFARFEEALDDPQVDLVVLATPNDLHAPQAIQAMQAGKHVVTDKPMCLSLAEADRMIGVSRQQDRLLSVFQNRRWDGDFLTVRRVLEEGLIGEPLFVEMFWGHHGPPRGWRSQQQHGGGRFIDLGAHLVDQALQLVPGPVERVYARFLSGVFDNDVEDHAHCALTFAGGVEVHVATSGIAWRPKPRWYVMGSRGTLVKEGVDPQERAMIAGDIDAAREDPAHYARLALTAAGRPAEMTIETAPGRWRSFYENIAAVLHGEQELAVTPQSARSCLAVLEAARQSAGCGQVVEVTRETG